MIDFFYFLGDFGDIYFDDEEIFIVFRQDGVVDFRWLVFYEFGYSLGFVYFFNKWVIMYLIYEESLLGNRLNCDDIFGI